MKKIQGIFFSVLSGILLWQAWPVSPWTPLIFIAWLPLLYTADRVTGKLHFYWLSLTTMLVWNTCTTWWIWNSSEIGALSAIIPNNLLMTLPWWGYRIFKRKFGQRTGYVSLIIFWMSFEFLHLNWQLRWPWLTLGNVFAMHPDWVQWYAYTGTSGGTLWVLGVNLLIYSLVKNWRTTEIRPKTGMVLVIAGLILLPILVSLSIKASIKSPDVAKNNVVIVQPNIDPYNEKFDYTTVSSQIQTLIRLSEEKLDSATRLVVWPETALSEPVWQSEVSSLIFYQPVFAFVQRHPGITLLTGIETFKNYGPQKATPTAQLNPRDHTYFDIFNAAVSIKAGQPLQFYDKSKLVPGVESLPDFLLWMGPVFEKFGGTAGGFGRSKTSEVFKEPDNPYITAPIICYESIYGEYVASYVRKGANILTIMTNDGWWGNTPGYRQHMEYARLRAIETRRWVVRSANTGISAVIDEKGAVLQTRPWDLATSFRAAVPTGTEETFFVRYGDLLSRICLAAAGLLVFWNLFLLVKKRMGK